MTVRLTGRVGDALWWKTRSHNLSFLWECISVRFLARRTNKEVSLEANYIFLKLQEVKQGSEHFNFLQTGPVKRSGFMRNIETLGFVLFRNG